MFWISWVKPHVPWFSSKSILHKQIQILSQALPGGLKIWITLRVKTVFYAKRRSCNQILEACGHVAHQLIHFFVCVSALCFWYFSCLRCVKCICNFRESHVVYHCCEWHLEVYFLLHTVTGEQRGRTVRSVCLFLFFVPSQRWLTACFSAWFGLFQHIFLFWPSYIFISSFSLFHLGHLPLNTGGHWKEPTCQSLIFPPLLLPHHQLQLWDTAGQERFRKSMVQHYYRNVHAVLFIYDVTCPASFSGLASWIEECRQNSLGQDIPR